MAVALRLVVKIFASDFTLLKSIRLSADAPLFQMHRYVLSLALRTARGRRTLIGPTHTSQIKQAYGLNPSTA
jgi:hypothetical protein